MTDNTNTNADASMPDPSDTTSSDTSASDTASASDAAAGVGASYANPFLFEASSRAGELIIQLHALLDELQTVDLTGCSDDELLALTGRSEQAIARLTFAGDRQLVECSDRDLASRMGYRSVPSFHNDYLRIVNPQRRREQMAATATFTSPSGAPLQPRHPALAAAFAAGEIGTSHLHTVLEVLDDIPEAIPHDVRTAAQRTMTDHARTFTPAAIATVGQRLIAHLDPDGQLTEPAERERKRGVWLNRQRADGTTKLNGRLTPLLASQLSTILAAWAAPGMNNPDDPDSPTGTIDTADTDQVAQAATRDLRSPAQRNHDALLALSGALLNDGLLGRSHRGLPIQVIVKADLADLERQAGLATTTTGHLLPIPDLLAEIDRGAADTWLSIFADSAPIPLYFGRGRRLASRPQRLAAFSRPDGHTCSVPGCDQPAIYLELHHADRDWAEGGHTDITELFGTCPIHNRRHHPTAPGHLSSRVIREGPNTGRCAWRLNTHPGAPPNPERINYLPDIAAHLTRHINQVRVDIHNPPHTPDTDGPTTAGDHTRHHTNDTTTSDTGSGSGDTGSGDTGTDTRGSASGDTGTSDTRTADLSLITEIRFDRREIVVLDSEVERHLHQLLTTQ